jgi:hypothetical protein
MKHTVMLALGAICIAAAPAAGQTIAQGMTPAQVQAEFGRPATSRVAGDWSYWYYHNGCPNRCGSDDVVFFQNDRVVAAVLRTSRRRYRGPQADDALRATDDGTSAVRMGEEPAGTVIVGGVRVEGAPPRNDDDGRVTPVRRRSPAPAPAGGTPVRAREGRPGEAPSIIIGGGDPEPGSVARPVTAPANVPAVDADDLSPAPVDANDPAPAANREATDLDGQTSVDRANQRLQRDRKNEETATERARRNDRRGNP